MTENNSKPKAELEDGYARIANALLDALASFDLSGRQFRVVTAVIRKTYGYRQKHDYLTASQIAQVMNYEGATTHINSDIRTLIAMKVLKKTGRFLGVNTELSEWIQQPKSDRKRSCHSGPKRPKTVSNVTENGHPEVTENGQNSDRNQSVLEGESGGSENPKVTENGLACDRKRSEKVTENGHHKRQKTLIQKNNNNPRNGSEGASDKKSKSSQTKFTDLHMQIAERMAKPVQDRFPTQKINLDDWADAIRKIIDIDKQTHDDLHKVWTYVTNHTPNGSGFSWALNCRSPMKLREHKDGLQYFEIIKNQMATATARAQGAKASSQHNFDNVDYHHGVNQDGSF